MNADLEVGGIHKTAPSGLALAIDGILTLSDSEVNTFRHYFAVILVTHLQLKELDDGGGPCIGRPIRPS